MEPQNKLKSKKSKPSHEAAFEIARRARAEWLANRGKPYQVPEGYPPRSLPASINDGFN